MIRWMLAMLAAAAALSHGDGAPGTPAPATQTAAAGHERGPGPRDASRFAFSVRRLSASRRATMTGTSWHGGCPVGLDDLRIVRVRRWSFDGDVRTGWLIVNADATHALRRVFRSLFDARFPIRRMRPVDAYDGSDYDSIEADNTSSFNCRTATGSTRFSEHAYGRAIDVNPLENPYVYADGTTSHPGSEPYLDRARHRRGMAFEGGALVAAFDAVGWGWGGRWPLPTDYQHFSANGR